MPGKVITVDEGATVMEFASGATDLLADLFDEDVNDAYTVQLIPGSMPDNGTVVLNADNTFSYTHDDSETLSDQFVYRVTDRGNNSTDVTVNVSVLAINDAPLGQDNAVSLLEDSPYTFRQADFGFSDPSEQHAFAGLVLDALPSDGALMLAGVPVSAGQMIAAADVAAGNLIYIPSADAHGVCLLYTSPSPRDRQKSRMPSSA